MSAALSAISESAAAPPRRDSQPPQAAPVRRRAVAPAAVPVVAAAPVDPPAPAVPVAAAPPRRRRRVEPPVEAIDEDESAPVSPPPRRRRPDAFTVDSEDEASPRTAAAPQPVPASSAIPSDNAIVQAFLNAIRAASGDSSGKQPSPHTTPSRRLHLDEDERESADDDQSPLSNAVLSQVNEIIASRAAKWRLRPTAGASADSQSLYPSHFAQSFLPTAYDDPTPSFDFYSASVIPWCATAVLPPGPPFGKIFPFRRADRGKTVKELRKTIASGAFVADVVVSFARSSVSSASKSSAIEALAGSLFDSATASGRDAPTLEWFAALFRYTEAVCVVFPKQRDGMVEYIRFLMDAATLIPIATLMAWDGRWREHCATMGTPINDWVQLFFFLQPLFRSPDPVRPSGRQPARSAASAGSVGSGAAPPSQRTASADLSAQICFAWNRRQCNGLRADGSRCARRHVCSKCMSADHQRPSCPQTPGFQGSALSPAPPAGVPSRQ